jgi:branched-chain amino acid transport system substrate-binding protein
VAIASLQKAPDLSGPSVREAIAQTKDFPGVAGTINLDENRDAVKPAVILQVQDGKTKFVTTLEP